MRVDWKGVYPAVTTQLHANLAVDILGTQRVVDGLIRDGVDGLIALGTVGENNSLEPAEKAALLAAIVEVTAGRVWHRGPSPRLCMTIAGGSHRSTTTSSLGCEQQIRILPTAGGSRGSGS